MNTKSNSPKTAYAIRCEKNGRMHIGCCTNVDQRIRQHIGELRRGQKTMRVAYSKRGDSPWQRDFNEYGCESFKAYILEENIPAETASDIEGRYILKYRTNEPAFGYNLAVPKMPLPIDLIEGMPPPPPVVST